MRVITKAPLELRGIEQKEGKNGLYHVYHVEESNGYSRNYITKNLELSKGLKKGDLVNVDFVETKYGLVIVGVEKCLKSNS